MQLHPLPYTTVLSRLPVTMIPREDLQQTASRKCSRTSRRHRTRLRRGLAMTMNSTNLTKALVLSLLCSSLLGVTSLPVPATRSNLLLPLDDVHAENSNNHRSHGAAAHVHHSEDISLRQAPDLSSLKPIPWPNATIPYAFDTSFPTSSRKKVLRAITHWQKKTCIKFVPHSIEPYFIKFILSDVCNSEVGLQTHLLYTGQEVHLTPSCAESRGNIIHELGHVVGLHHEVVRHNRDEYIEVLWDNLRPGTQRWFLTLSEKENPDYGVPYDLGSVMHFGAKDFAKRGRVAFVLRPNVTYDGKVGQRASLSLSDIARVQGLYNCHGVTGGEVESLNVIRAGNPIAFRAISDHNQNWIGCDAESCTLDNCPGNRFRPDMRESCSRNVFSMNNADGSKRLLVGNRVILRTTLDVTTDNGQTVICQDGNCESSDSCELALHRCQEHFVVLNVTGKSPGDEIEHQDQVILSYGVRNFERSWFSCDLSTDHCEKLVCLDENAVTGDGIGSGFEGMPLCDSPFGQTYEIHKLN